MNLLYTTRLLTFLACCMGTSKTVFNLIKNGDFVRVLAEEWDIKKELGVRVFVDSAVNYSGNNSVELQFYLLCPGAVFCKPLNCRFYTLF